jgi:predicted SprT family Zn-dependent metalloprotease
MMTEKDIIKICEETFAREGELFCDIEVKINGRLKATLGQCHYEQCGFTVYPTRIEISRSLIEEHPEQVRDTVIHECAHAIVCLQTGERHGHDSVWKACARRLGISDERCADNAASEKYKYVCSCTQCNQIVGRYFRAGKVVKYPQFYSCGHCGGQLKVEQLY